MRCSFGHNQRRRGREPEPEPEREPQQQREPREMDFDNELGERPSASADGVEASSAAWEQSRFAPFSLPLQSEQMEIWSVCDDSCDSEDDDGERCIPRDGSVRVCLRSRAHLSRSLLHCAPYHSSRPCHITLPSLVEHCSDVRGRG